MFKKILIVSKMTELEFDEYLYDAEIESIHRQRNVDTKALIERDKIHYKTFEKIVSCFTDYDVNLEVIKRQNVFKRDLDKGWDLVVVVGGDGTFMDVARYIHNETPLFGIKSSPFSLGGHYHTNLSNADAHIRMLFEGALDKDFNIRPRTRVQGVVENGNTIVDYALNEILVGDVYKAGYDSLDILYKGEIYETGSSGLIVSTYNGKTGWYDNIPIQEKNPEVIAKYRAAMENSGLENRDILLRDSDFKNGEETIVRYKTMMRKSEGPCTGNDYGTLLPGEKMVVVCKVISDGAVTFDGHKPTRIRKRVYPLYYGNHVTISISDNPLNCVEFEK